MILVCHGDPSKPAVLLLHGFLGDGNDFDLIINGLSENHCPYTLDLPGHGRSVASTGSLFAADDPLWKEWERALGEGPDAYQALLGYSMGGRVAQMLHARWPGRFHSLILESAGTGLNDPEARRLRREKDLALSKKLEACHGKPNAFEAFLRDWYGQPLFAGMADVDATIRSRLTGNPMSLARALRDLSVAHMPDMRIHLAEHFGPGKKPLLLIAGEKDTAYRTSLGEIAERCGVPLRVMAGAGHNGHRDQPAEYGEIVRTFLGTFKETRDRAISKTKR